MDKNIKIVEKKYQHDQHVRLWHFAFWASPYVFRANLSKGCDNDGASKLNGCLTNVTGDFERLLDINGGDGTDVSVCMALKTTVAISAFFDRTLTVGMIPLIVVVRVSS